MEGVVMFRCTVWGVKIEMPYPNEQAGIRSPTGLAQAGAFEGAIACGGWEQCERDRIGRFLLDTDVIEFGGGTGFISCFTNKLMKNNRLHLVYEASPLLIEMIENNRNINGCNFKVINKAYNAVEKSINYEITNVIDNIVAYDTPTIFNVDAVSLADVLTEYPQIEEYTLVMDVEGSENGLVLESEALKKCKAVFIDIHKSGYEAGGKGFAWTDVNKFLLEEGFVLKDRCGCVNWVGAYAR